VEVDLSTRGDSALEREEGSTALQKGGSGEALKREAGWLGKNVNSPLTGGGGIREKKINGGKKRVK